MAGTITATVSGGRSVAAGLLFLAANVATSAAVGLLLAVILQPVPQAVLLLALAAVCCAYLGVFVVRGRVPWLRWPRQLPATWLDRARPRRTAVRYGLVWGLTFSTPIRAGSLVALGLLVAVRGQPLAGAVLFGVVGLLRSLPAALAPFLAPTDGPEVTRRWPRFHRPIVNVFDAAALTVLLGVVVQSVRL